MVVKYCGLCEKEITEPGGFVEHASSEPHKRKVKEKRRDCKCQ